MEPRFSLALRACAERKKFGSGKFDPRTRLVRGMCDGKLVLSNRFETPASLDFPKLKPIHT